GDEAYRREQATLLRRAWRLVGHESMLKDAGDYLTDLVGGAPVIVVRGADGEIRAFHNVCRHRAGPLATDYSGNCGKELTCKYHGWRYALDGRLRSAVDFGAPDGFDPREFALFGARLENWRGYLFVNLDPSAVPVADELAPLEDLWARRDVPAHPFTLRRTHEIACNWKTYVENYLEGYHVKAVHPELSTQIETDRYTVTMHGCVSVHEAPPTGGGATDGLWAWVWPDLGVNVYRHGVMMERMTPLGADRTRLDFLYFYDPAHLDELDWMLKMSDQVTLEDKEICEQVQRNLNAGVYRAGVLSPKHETGVAWFQARIREAHSGPNPVRATA
ncbi:MAG TPA: aromatic ring-hydroxylating dioxygenase subunit alpha, partial [Caulobacteraceae bacterium]|nr:aromatic ring-hydroxylating dioxygenase subunit alpha [Caulobacteraceae bacterium]